MSEQWDGRPQNPERDGWHWLQWGSKAPEVLYWDVGMWWDTEGRYREPSDFTRCTYIAPCHTPAEVSALVEAARRDEREACAKIALRHEVLEYAGPIDGHARVMASVEIAAAIRARGDA